MYVEVANKGVKGQNLLVESIKTNRNVCILPQWCWDIFRKVVTSLVKLMQLILLQPVVPMNASEWMSVSQKFHYFTLWQMFNCVSNLCPLYLSDPITMQREISYHPFHSVEHNIIYIPNACNIHEEKFFILWCQSPEWQNSIFICTQIHSWTYANAWNLRQASKEQNSLTAKWWIWG